MKKIYIVAIVMIAIAIALLTNAAGDMSTYSTFKDAANGGNQVRIAGQLAKDKEMYYNPEEDPNYFTFFVRDNEGEEKKVVLHGAKPKDFEMSEQIVVTGRVDGDEFIASDILMKCPSKYKDEEVQIKARKGS
ncbi:MAG: cytochrome c maturation protein CcmE [Saprospiraceae bacterium]